MNSYGDLIVRLYYNKDQLITTNKTKEVLKWSELKFSTDELKDIYSYLPLTEESYKNGYDDLYNIVGYLDTSGNIHPNYIDRIRMFLGWLVPYSNLFLFNETNKTLLIKKSGIILKPEKIIDDGDNDYIIFRVVREQTS